MRQSLGGIRDEEIEAVALKGCIWIHGASVGEIVATSPLVKEIRKAMPEIPFRQLRLAVMIWRARLFRKQMPLFISRWICLLCRNPL